MATHTRRRILSLSCAGLAMGLVFAGHALAQDPVTLTILLGNDPNGLASAQEVIKDFEAANPGIKIEIETRTVDAQGDNLVKSRLATGEMTDMFNWNSGALFQTLNPSQTLVDLTDEPFQANVIESYKPTVMSNGRVYGAPWGTAMGGGVVYNKKIYADLGLSVPKSWDEFMANSQKIKDAGIPPVIQSFGTDWSAQIFVLADFYNVYAADPTFPEKYTANQAKYATTPAALAGFQHQEDVFKAGFLNADFASATLEDALRMVATGEGAQYPQLSFAISNIKNDHPDHINDIGYFAMPGAPEHNGLTVWMPGALYIANTSEHIDEAKKFAAFVASPAGCAAMNRVGTPTGPYLVKDCPLPADVPPAVADLAPYFAEDGRTAPALEFLSPVKGPLMPQITTEVGSGVRSALEGAQLYDEDVRKQALQLGLPGW